MNEIQAQMSFLRRKFIKQPRRWSFLKEFNNIYERREKNQY
jgi:hypothetical protein